MSSGNKTGNANGKAERARPDVTNHSDRDPAVGSNASNEQRLLHGVPIPARERAIDAFGYETTKHSLRFRGEDWDVVLNTKRDALTAAFTAEAALATGDAAENIRNIRYSVDGAGRLLVKFTVRHKAQTASSVVQDRLATHVYRTVTALYVPRRKRPAPAARMKKQSSLISPRGGRRQQPNVSFFGRNATGLGPNGPEFRDMKEEEELLEPERPLSRAVMSTLLA